MSEKTNSSHTVMGLSRWRGLLVLGVCLLGASLAIAQLTTGTITGTVTDPSGAAVPGAAVTVKNVDTGISRALVTGPNGHYEAPNLPVGNYEVSVALPGFQTTVRMGIELTVGRTAVVDLVLQVGQVTQNVTVTGEAPLLDTTSATVSHLIDEKRVGELPLNNRDLTQLTFLQPGVLRIPGSGNQGVFSGMGDKLSVSGARGTQNLYLLDGVSNADLSGNAQGASGSYIGAETVKELQIVTNNYSAEYKSAAGAIVSAVTKSGTNALHGSAFEFLRNDNFDAAKWEDNAAGRAKPEFKRNQFGGSLGGPIRKDRTFFFGSYEGLRERLGGTDFARVPTALARTGVLPTKTVTVPSVVKPYLDLFPVPGQGNTIVQDFKDGTVRIAGALRQPTTDNFVAGRFDHQFSGGKKGFLSGTYNYDKADRSPFGLLTDTSGAVGGIASKRHIVSVRHTSVLSTTSVNEFNFGYSFTQAQGDLPLTKRDFSNLLFRTGRKLVGQLNVGELSAVGYRVDLSSYTQKSFSFKDGLSLARGKHSLRMGAEISRYHYDQFSCSRGCQGIYDFRTLETFLTNVPRQFQVMLPGGDNPGRNMNQIPFGAYFQDNYAVFPSLTLNLGVRYEFVTVPSEENDQISNLVNFFDSNVSVPASIVPKYPTQKFAGTINRFFTNATLKSISPRFGFAWAPGSKKTSVRGGFGIFYEFPMLYNIRTALQELPPFVLVGRVRDTDAARAGTTLRFPDAFSTQLPLLRGTPNIRTMEYNQRDAYIYRWSLTIQRELRGNWLVSAGYTGSRALHLWQQVLPNINRWQGWPNQPTGPKFWPAGTPTAINPIWGEMRLQNANGNSYYQGLAVGAQKRFSHGFQFQAAYTFSKAIDNGSGVTSNGDELPQSQRGIYAWDMGLKRGLSSFDIRQALTANFSFEPPVGKNLTGVAGALGKGWQWNGIVTLSAGYPLSVLDTNNAQIDRIGDNEELRPDLIPGGKQNPVSGTTSGCPGVAVGQKLGGPSLYYDPCQFTPSRVGFYGTLGRNTVISPGLFTFNISVFKNFAVRENSRFQFRAEFFNLFNRANFGNPDMTAFTATGGRNPSAGQITNTRTTSRQIQFGLKYIF